MVYLITGKSDAGKTRYAKAFADELMADGHKVVCIDGDEFRQQTNNDDFSDQGRILNLTEAAKLAADLESKGNIVLVSFVAPKRAWRNMMRQYWHESQVVYLPGGTLWEGTTYERPEFRNGQLE